MECDNCTSHMYPHNDLGEGLALGATGRILSLLNELDDHMFKIDIIRERIECKIEIIKRK